jgi:threonine synthase
MQARRPERAWFASIDPSEKDTWPLDEVVYRSPRGALLEVVHDMDALRARSGGEWRALFEARWRTPRGPWSSGVWGKKEWVCPGIDDADIVTLGEGATPLTPLPRLAGALGAGEVWLKQCGTSHTGSFKDLGMTVLVSMVHHMRRRGRDIPAVACASTGDTSAALAAYCAAAGIPAVVLLPRGKVSAAQLIQPLCNGAHVLTLDTDFDGCMAVVQRLTQARGIYLANSMNSLRVEGQKTVAIELTQQLDWEVPDFVIIPGGNLGNVSALGAGFQMMLDLGLVTRRPRIVCAQAERANPLYQSFRRDFDGLRPITAGTTQASAIRIGNPVSYDKAVRVLRAFDGIVTQATENELAEATARADREGAFTCPHTGVALAALAQLTRDGVMGRQHRVVVVATAHGLKFTEFKTGYHLSQLADVTSRLANLPVELPPDEDVVWRELERRIGR